MAVSVAMKAHLASPVTTLCQAWKVVARDGTTIRLCAHTRTLTIDGETYTPAPLQPAQIEAQSGVVGDNFEVQAILASGLFTEIDFLAGKWDAARVEMRVVNYLDLSMGNAVRFVGQFGQITTKNGFFTAELFSLAALLDQDGGETTSPHCRVRRLGDSRCKVSLASFTHATTVSSVSSRRVFNVGTTQADGYFDSGTIKFTSGANIGAEMEIRKSTGARIELMMPLPREISAGDAVTLIAGCDRTRGTCKSRFNNVINFQGEPDLPGDRKALKIPE